MIPLCMCIYVHIPGVLLKVSLESSLKCPVPNSLTHTARERLTSSTINFGLLISNFKTVKHLVSKLQIHLLKHAMKYLGFSLDANELNLIWYISACCQLSSCIQITNSLMRSLSLSFLILLIHLSWNTDQIFAVHWILTSLNEAQIHSLSERKWKLQHLFAKPLKWTDGFEQLPVAEAMEVARLKIGFKISQRKYYRDMQTIDESLWFTEKLFSLCFSG